jgi:threonine aldolase
MEAALFCPSGTMTNQLAIRVHTQPGSDVICDKYSHIYLYEGGGIMLNSLVVGESCWMETAAGISAAIRFPEAISPENDIHSTLTRLVSLGKYDEQGWRLLLRF